MSITIIDQLFSHVQTAPNRVAFRYLQDLDCYHELSYKSLWIEASEIANFLKSVAPPGSCILLFFPPGLEYVKAFYGCLIAGMIAVPLYPPRRNTKSDRVIKVAQDCQACVALTTQSEISSINASWNDQDSPALALRFYAVDNIPAGAQPASFSVPSDISINAPAFLQYTSGSTGNPKGVIITHGNIIANVTYLSLMAIVTKDDVFVNWLPLFHDLGLVTAVLWPVNLGAPSTLMAPATFVRNPGIWLKAISRYRGSVCGAPNFAYDLCTKKITDSDLIAVDLSSWRVAYNAAEPVRADTLNNFSARFSHCGFSAEAFYPAYGMAEATVFITGGNPQIKPAQLTVSRRAINENKFEIVDDSDLATVKLVSCGGFSSPHEIRIVDVDTGCELDHGNIGEIWFAGPSVSPGYWKLSELSNTTFNQKVIGMELESNNYLKTGDLGVIWNDELFVTGRIKDLIILQGKNYYPQDLESSTTFSHPYLRRGYCAAFSVTENNTERLVIVAEVEREYFRNVNVDAVISAIRFQIVRDHEINADHVVLVKPYTIPVTSSGKIQRKKTRQLLLNQQLTVIAQADISYKPDYVKPSSEMECILSGIWCSVLELDSIGVTDNFFDVGGNSLRALEISSEIQEKFSSIKLDAEQVLECTTISQLSQFLEIKMAHKKNHGDLIIDKQPRKVIVI